MRAKKTMSISRLQSRMTALSFVVLVTLFTIGCRDNKDPVRSPPKTDTFHEIQELNLQVLVPHGWECGEVSGSHADTNVSFICVEKDTSSQFRSNYNVVWGLTAGRSFEDYFNSHEAEMLVWELSDWRVDSMEVHSHDTTMIHNERFGVVEFRFIYENHPLRARQVFTIRSDTCVLVTFMCAENRLPEAEPVFDRVMENLRFGEGTPTAEESKSLGKRGSNDPIRNGMSEAFRVGFSL